MKKPSNNLEQSTKVTFKKIEEVANNNEKFVNTINAINEIPSMKHLIHTLSEEQKALKIKIDQLNEIKEIQEIKGLKEKICALKDIALNGKSNTEEENINPFKKNLLNEIIDEEIQNIKNNPKKMASLKKIASSENPETQTQAFNKIEKLIVTELCVQNKLEKLKKEKPKKEKEKELENMDHLLGGQSHLNTKREDVKVEKSSKLGNVFSSFASFFNKDNKNTSANQNPNEKFSTFQNNGTF